MAVTDTILWSREDGPDRVIENPLPGQTYQLEGDGTIQNNTDVPLQLYAQDDSAPTDQIDPGHTAPAPPAEHFSVYCVV
ncbi:hypothetical protein [Streptomyces hainanensis]|uniref:Uncharacterized protein n=1 Tax=Streptomyces hainanensis TaxID=402648 RepID=A0A4R4SHH2_9ACTN|nr:hypothetical protein [Streptomyces hainanensis]TDC60883.1 hypothetical protein E1283_35805 [Streptomyces hainanensis]